VQQLNERGAGDRAGLAVAKRDQAGLWKRDRGRVHEGVGHALAADGRDGLVQVGVGAFRQRAGERIVGEFEHCWHDIFLL